MLDDNGASTTAGYAGNNKKRDRQLRNEHVDQQLALGISEKNVETLDHTLFLTGKAPKMEAFRQAIANTEVFVSVIVDDFYTKSDKPAVWAAIVTAYEPLDTPEGKVWCQNMEEKYPEFAAYLVVKFSQFFATVDLAVRKYR